MAFHRLYGAMHDLANEDHDAVSALMLANYFWERATELSGKYASGTRRRDVQEWWLTWMGTGGKSAARNRTARRELMLRWCRTVADQVKSAADPAYTLDRATDNAVRNFRSLLPEEEYDTVRAQRAHVRSLIEAMVSNVGGAGKRATTPVDQAIENLFEAVGWPVSVEAIRKARSRSKAPARPKKKRATKKGH